MHRYYQEQYQLDGGKQDRYTTGSDAIGLTQGYYRTQQLPLYTYLHEPGHPRYAIEDDFFQAAFGGSFLNHQWLIAAATPTFPNPPASLRSTIDSNGMVDELPALHGDRGGLRQVRDRDLCPVRGGRQVGPRLRRLRGEHGAAAVPAVLARNRRGEPAAGADGADDR